LREAQIIDVLASRDLAFYGRIWASGNATLTGPLHRASLRSSDVTTSARSELFIPITDSEIGMDAGFIVFADSTGNVPDFRQLVERENLLAERPVGERTFLDGLEMELNIYAPQGSTVHLVMDPLLGDEIIAVGSGRIQLQRREGEFFTYGSLDVNSGDYLFTAGDVFFRRFLIDNGSITWDGDPADAQLNIWGSYRTRASRAGLPGEQRTSAQIPVVVRLHITGRVSTPAVDLSLGIERHDRDLIGNFEGLETVLNQPERSTEYATSVLLTNSFLLTTSTLTSGDPDGLSTRSQFAFASVSQLVASQVNRYLNQALPNIDFSFGLQQGERAQDLDVTYGVALRLLDERLIIRGQGIYGSDQVGRNRGEFVVEVRLSPAVSVEVFYRREGDVLSYETLTNTTGAGLSYQTQFATWRRLFQRILGISPDPAPAEVAEAG
jgi:translocation and assembly module TamB